MNSITCVFDIMVEIMGVGRATTWLYTRNSDDAECDRLYAHLVSLNKQHWSRRGKDDAEIPQLRFEGK